MAIALTQHHPTPNNLLSWVLSRSPQNILHFGLEQVCGFLGQISWYYLTLPTTPIGGMLGIAIPAAHAAIAYGY